MKFKFIILALILLGLTTGCSKVENPMVFEKIQPPPVKIAPPPPPEYTLLDLYLMEQIDTDYMMNWFFKDYKGYRYKLFYTKSLIESMEPLTQHDRDRILLLQFTMNEAIQKFNNRNFFARATAVVRAGFESRDKNRKDPQESLSDIKNQGASAKHISDNPVGFLGSFNRYGFKIEKVKLLDDESVNTKSNTHE